MLVAACCVLRYSTVLRYLESGYCISQFICQLHGGFLNSALSKLTNNWCSPQIRNKPTKLQWYLKFFASFWQLKYFQMPPLLSTAVSPNPSDFFDNQTLEPADHPQRCGIHINCLSAHMHNRSPAVWVARSGFHSTFTGWLYRWHFYNICLQTGVMNRNAAALIFLCDILLSLEISVLGATDKTYLDWTNCKL